jgi:hypothetical protein
MRDAELFQVALGLSFPWKVMSSDFDAQAGRLDIRIDFPRGSRFCCPTCGTSGPAYDTREMTISTSFSMKLTCRPACRAYSAQGVASSGPRCRGPGTAVVSRFCSRL